MENVGIQARLGKTLFEDGRHEKEPLVTAAEVLKLVERQGYRCALTDRELNPKTASLDHVIPTGKGGEHLITNTQVLHKAVNRAKGTMTNEEFVAMCREVVEHDERKRSGAV